MTPPKLLLFPFDSPHQDSSPVHAWRTAPPQPISLLRKPLFPPIPHPLPSNQCPSGLTLLSFQAAKKTTGAKRPLRRRSTKKASSKRPTSSVKSKEARGTTLFGHYHRLNEELNQDEPEEDGESMEKPSTSRAYLHHGQLQSETTDLREESSEKSLTSDP